MKKITPWIFIIVILIAAFLRFCRLGDVPVGIHRDEAFLGYNAYSILKNGRDMSGQPWPLHFSSFLYSPGGYAYAAIPPIALFGLTPFAVRFPSAFFGLLTVIAVYFLVRELFREEKYHDACALFASLSLALSPWHINLSRTATEHAVAVFFLIVGLHLFILWTRKNHAWLLVSAMIALVLPLGIYQAPRSFLPLFIPLLYYTFRKRIPSWKLPILLYCLFILLPVVMILFSPKLSLRLRTVSIFSTEETQLTVDEQIREDGTREVTPFVSRFFHNKVIAYSFAYLKNYFAHFTYDFLFSDAASPDRYRVPGMGLLYLADLPLLLMGIGWLIHRRNKEKTLLIGWFILSFAGSALTFDDIPNLQRTLMVVPVLSIVIAWGAITAIAYAKGMNQKRLLAFLVVCAYGLNVLYYLHQYSVHQVVHRPWYRHEGYKELVSTVNSLLPQFSNVVITDRESAPTIFFLFYGMYDPAQFQGETSQPSDQSIDRRNFGPYEFTQEECPMREESVTDKITGKQSKVVVGEPDILYVNWGGCKLPEKNVRLLDEIKRSDGTTVFQIASVSPIP